MKTKQILLILILTTSYLNAQIVNIPDTNFKATLLHHTIDTNEDGEIQVSEAEAYTDIINVGAYVREFYSIGKIADMTGLEAFSNITGFQCDENLLTSLDLSQNTQITYLRCDQNAITELDLSNNLELLDVNCSINTLSTLDLINNTALITLDCSENQLVNINISTCSELNSFNCSANPLSIIDVTNNLNIKDLFCSNTNITNIDVSQNLLLESLLIISNQLTNIDISNNTNLRELYCHKNQLTSLNTSQNTLLGLLLCQDNQITHLDLSQNNLGILFCYNNQLTSLDVSNSTILYQLKCQNNDLSYLDIRNGNNMHLNMFDTTDNPNLTCIFVDNLLYMEEYWEENIDETSHFVETQEQCDAIGVVEIQLPTINIYPNPIATSFTIQTDMSYQNIKIFNSLGILIGIFPKQNVYNIAILSSGVYYIQLQSTNQFISKKIIIN